MPELIATTAEAIPQVVENDKSAPLLANDPILMEVEKAIGLRITGGRDFDMPITIFHVAFFLSEGLNLCLLIAILCFVHR
jgi:hypothetical protein